MLGLAVVLQLTSLYLAPIIVVQPLGAIALVITAMVNARVSKVKLDIKSIRAIAFCVGGVGLFVTVAAFTAKSSPINSAQLGVILALLGVITMGLSLAFAFLRDRFKAIVFILGAGVLYGFVATLAKVVIDRAKTGDFEWLTVTCIVALLAAAALGGYFVQNAYSSGPPDLVIAGLTVVDPIVAVTIGIVVLQEASGAPWFAAIAYIAAGALAVYGVFQLSKHHPQAQR
jgi:drug/metabolite transporter (DMT)-like permease